MQKLAIVTTHPIQYNAPWFRLLAQRNKVQVKVFYTWSQSKISVKDRVFGQEITWDIPLLDGYDFEFIENVSKTPGSHHFFGIDCPSLIPKIKVFQPDAILFFGWNFKSHLLAMRHFKKKIPVWFRGDSTLINEVGGLKTKLRRMVLKKVYTYVDKALYVGKANKDYFTIHGLKPNQLVYAPHAIDNERFRDNVSNNYVIKALKWRHELGYKTDDLVVLYAGKFEPIKQPELLIEVINTVNKLRSKPLHLLLVGNGPLEYRLKELAKNEATIQFLGFQNQTQMPIVYRLGNVFCLPSKSETWGLAINEAMASGKPIIVSNKVGCAEDLIKPNENGFIFNYDNKQDLITIFKELTINRLEVLGNNSTKMIASYSFEDIARAIEFELSNL